MAIEDNYLSNSLSANQKLKLRCVHASWRMCVWVCMYVCMHVCVCVQMQLPEPSLELSSCERARGQNYKRKNERDKKKVKRNEEGKK